MYKYICNKCKREFNTRKKGQIYCSKSCANSVNTSKRKINDNSIFLDGINEVSAYILGLILSDGCLSFDEHSKRERITISMNDIEIIEYLRKAYSPSKKLYEYKNPKGRRETYTFISTNEYDINYIKSKGLVERKSSIIRLPNIESECMRHMIRGIFDGDGSVYINKTRTNYNDNEKYYYYVNSSFTTGSYEFAKEINLILKNNNINSRIVRDSRKNISCWYVKIYSKMDIERFYEFMYLESTIYIERKRNLFNMMI